MQLSNEKTKQINRKKGELNKYNYQMSKIPRLCDANDVLSGENTNVQKISIYNDLNELKKEFGKYTIFRSGSPEIFIDKIENYLKSKYGKPDIIIAQFFLFIDKDLYDWYFKLDNITRSSFDLFKSSFIDEIKRLEYNYYELVDMKKDEFFEKLKVFKNDV
jgi:hypothetical protein